MQAFSFHFGCHVTNFGSCNMMHWLNFGEEKLCSWITFALCVKWWAPTWSNSRKRHLFLASIWNDIESSMDIFLFPKEILTGCCRWRCLTFSGCSDGFSICHSQGHTSHGTVMGRGCQNWSKMARHFPYYLTTAVRLQNKIKRMPCETYTLFLRNLPPILGFSRMPITIVSACWNALF